MSCTLGLAEAAQHLKLLAQTILNKLEFKNLEITEARLKKAKS
jgi:hypothetical protein